jgi:hypothetical protein
MYCRQLLTRHRLCDVTCHTVLQIMSKYYSYLPVFISTGYPMNQLYSSQNKLALFKVECDKYYEVNSIV